MADRTCERCGKEFAYPSFLARHRGAKKSCAIFVEKEDLPAEAQEDPDLDKKRCRFCGRVFKTEASKTRHVRDACKVAPNAKNGDAGMERLHDYVTRRQQVQIEALTSRLAAAERQLAAGAGAPPRAGSKVEVVGDHANVSVVNNTINITNNFGSENTSHITEMVVQTFLLEALRRTQSPEEQVQILATLLSHEVWCNGDHPENATAYLPSVKRSGVLTWLRGKWVARPIGEVAPRMHKKVVDITYDNQPKGNELIAAKVAPLLRALDESERPRGVPTQVYQSLLFNARALARK